MDRKQIEERVQAWLQDPFDEETKREVEQLARDPQKLSDAFFQELSFGTGGMRAVMGAGTNRMNRYTVRAATLGLARYLRSACPEEARLTVLIGYDVRHNSRLFAEETARVLAAQGIQALITAEVCPTPLVSFGCRHYSCTAAVMITASHNPPEYNGYKVYWSDGGQVVAPHDAGIIAEVRSIRDWATIPVAPLSSPLIRFLGEELLAAYLAAIRPLQLFPGEDKKKLSIHYTPLHGTGRLPVSRALQDWGYSPPHLVPAQTDPDPQFHAAPSPNPEEESALRIGTEQLTAASGDLLLATDPDADRLGAVVLDRGRPCRLTGNQIACLCFYHLCSTLALQKKIPDNGALVKTIVTTELLRAIARHFGVACFDVLTGFKYIGEKIDRWEKSFDGMQFLFGAEESYGYLYGTHAHDKDAVVSSCLLAEAAWVAKRQNITLADRLHQLYEKFGIYREGVKSLSFPNSASGMEERNRLMERLRSHPPRQIGPLRIDAVEDFLHQTTSPPTEQALFAGLPPSDVLRFWLEDGSKLVIRPSGTEPKIKIYAEVIEKEGQSDAAAIERADERVRTLLNFLEGNYTNSKK
jgi:phosphoglucomutase/phosphomannomutase